MMERIKKFFRNLFGISQNYLEAPKNDVHQNEILYTNYEKLQSRFNQFQEQIKIESNPQEEKALKLQRDYKAGIIEEEDLTEEDFDILSNLYENQIQNTKASIENYRKKILNIQTKLVQNN